MDKKQLIIDIETFKNDLIAKATDGTMSELDYKKYRKELISIDEISDYIPIYIKTCSSSDAFRRNIQAKFKHYYERRNLLDQDFGKLIYEVEQMSFDENSIDEHFEIGELIGRGGFGEVYKIKHNILEMDFALKILNPSFIKKEDIEEYNKRFFREAKMLFSLNHRNIVQFYDVGYIDGKPFIRMEYIEGINFNQFPKKYSTISFKKSLKPMFAFMKGIKHAHKIGIIHRDLKPSNFMMTNNGDFKIIDFGVGAYINQEAYTKLTPTGMSIAGGRFTDPNLLDDPNLKDVRSDIYSLGAFWYYLIVGYPPTGSDLENNLLETGRIKNEEARIILKCLNNNIEKRYSKVDDVLADLDSLNNIGTK